MRNLISIKKHLKQVSENSLVEFTKNACVAYAISWNADNTYRVSLYVKHGGYSVTKGEENFDFTSPKEAVEKYKELLLSESQ